ncbi:MAG: hypothetical protein PHX62_05430 [Bacilli bacterium]|nr:hypothetical protein [Bacilli bacterium]
MNGQNNRLRFFVFDNVVFHDLRFCLVFADSNHEEPNNHKWGVKRECPCWDKWTYKVISCKQDTCENAILSSIDLDMDEEDWKYCNSILGQIAFGVIKIWVNDGCKESAEELYRIMKREINIISNNL